MVFISLFQNGTCSSKPWMICLLASQSVSPGLLLFLWFLWRCFFFPSYPWAFSHSLSAARKPHSQLHLENAGLPFWSELKCHFLGKPSLSSLILQSAEVKLMLSTFRVPQILYLSVIRSFVFHLMAVLCTLLSSRWMQLGHQFCSCKYAAPCAWCQSVSSVHSYP